MPKDKFDFSRKFQEGILHFLLVQQKFADYAIPKLKFDYFTADNASLLFDLISKYYKKYRKISKHDILNEIKVLKILKKDKKKLLYSYTKKVCKGTYNYDYTIKHIIKFIKSRVYNEKLQEAYDLTNECNFSEVDKSMRELSKLEFESKIGTMFSRKKVKENANRISIEERNEKHYIKTGIDELDYYITGARDGEFLLLMAGPSAGKSFGLVHLAKTAMVFGKKVLYYTISELAEDLIFQRLLMNVCKATTKETINDLDKIYKRVDKFFRTSNGKILIKKFGTATMEDIRAHYNYMMYQGFKADMVIIDYMDYVKSYNFRNDRFQQLDEICGDICAMAGDFNIPIWSASATNRSAQQKEVVGMADETGSYQKSYRADVIIGISCTPEELAEDEDGHTRAKLYLAKSRSKGNAHKVIPIVQDKHRMQFVVNDKKYLNVVKDEDKNKGNDKK